LRPIARGELEGEKQETGNKGDNQKSDRGRPHFTQYIRYGRASGRAP
jgi:hypothetical protein